MSKFTDSTVVLRSDRLRLRRFTPADVALLVELDSDPEVMRYVNGGHPTPRNQIETDVIPVFLSFYDSTDRYGYWAVEARSTGEFLGWFHLRPARHSPHDPELGFRLCRAAWGRGYATEMAQKLVERAFDDPQTAKVVAIAMPSNTASVAVMQKVGMSFVRAFRHPLGADVVEYSIGRAVFERR